MKKIISILISLAMTCTCISTFAEEEKAGEGQFQPYINGYEDKTFRPERMMTKAEACGIFSELIKNTTEQDVSFSDVSKDAWYYKALCNLNANSYLRTDKGEYYPEKLITRSELCEYVYILKNGPSNISKSDMFSNLIGQGIIKGYDDGSFGADKNITRAEAVTLINRALGVVADAPSVAALNLKVFTDITDKHWAFYNVMMAAKGTRELISYPQEPPKDLATKKFDKYNELGREWETVPMINDALRQKGVKIGGEGGQRMNSIAISADGSFLLCGNDTDTIHRSIDGGETWENCNRGYLPISGEAFAIDPNNADRCISYGSKGDGSGNQIASNGIYLSTDRGLTWKQVLSQLLGGGQLELKECLCYDASSYDEELGGSAVAYWSKNYWLRPPSFLATSEEQVLKTDSETEHKGLWKTTDGGETWFVVNEEMTDSIVKTNPETGVVYCANNRGFFRSEDGGVTFKHILSGAMIYGMDVIATQPNNVYINDYKGVLISTDSGKTFSRIKSTTFPASTDRMNPYKSNINLKVSPSNPQNMVLAGYSGFGAYQCKKYYSNDGGVTWAQSKENEEKDFLKTNNREAMFVWHPTENKVWSFGGDWVVSSTDGGKTYTWDYEGGSAIFVDQRTIFNIYNPDIFYYGSQDFHGALTIDGGKNWKHIWKVVSNRTSGFVYGSYAADANTLIALTSTGQAMNGVGGNGGWNGVSELMVSRDRGETWTRTGKFVLRNHRKKWAELCYQSPTDPNVLFAAYYRSDDFGYSWEEMDIDVVCAHNPYGKKELYGVKGQSIMVSYDNGVTWDKYCDVELADPENPTTTNIWDIAYDGINNIMYYVSGPGYTGTHFCKYENGVTTEMKDRIKFSDSYNTFQVCAVDPRYPNVIYVGGYAGGESGQFSVMRSVDGGETFQNMGADPETTIVKTGQTVVSVSDLIVHPLTGELYVPQVNGGWKKIGPPYEN